MEINEKIKIIFNNYNFLQIDEDYILTDSKLININTDKEIIFKDKESLLKYKHKGKTLKEIIDNLKIVYSGGRGANADRATKSIWTGPEGMGNGIGKKTKYPAEFNVDRKPSFEGTTKSFAKKYKNAKVEYGIEVDSNGYVYQHKQGTKGTVRITSHNKETIIIHNHPNGSHFSKTDLLNATANKYSKGVYAITPSGTAYKFEKTHKFQAEKFARALPKAKTPSRFKTHAEQADYWLSKNQKKYGYTYRQDKI